MYLTEHMTGEVVVLSGPKLSNDFVTITLIISDNTLILRVE